MTTDYVNRRLKLIGDDNRPPLLDKDFANLDGPKVLLGDPGIGKTATCEYVTELLNGRLVHAEDLVSDLCDHRPKYDKQILVIDGLDEVYSVEIQKAIPKILNKIADLGFSNWLISCRAPDWNLELFNPRIESKFGTPATIAGIESLSDEETISLLKTSGPDDDPEAFMADAKAHEVADFLSNPQTLKMLFQTVQESGWPRTKTELYSSACKKMVSEHNKTHQSINQTRPNETKLLEVAGWVCAQLLLSGCRGVNFEGRTDANFPRPADLTSAEYAEDQIRMACETKLFKVAEKGNFEFVHRTVAEFLAGRWLAEEFSTKLHNLSPPRVLHYLTFGADVVPPSLRGLLAWITSLDQSARLRNIKLDPFGCLRYGDLSNFADNELVHLLNSLVDHAKSNPSFLLQDWHTPFGRGLGRISIKNDFIKVILSNNTPFELRYTLIKCIKGAELADIITNDLHKVALDETCCFAERYSAVTALKESAKETDWRSLAEALFDSNTADNLRLSIDHVLPDHLEQFSGAEIANHLIAYDRFAYQEGRRFTLGVGIHIPEKCSDEQALEIAQLLAQNLLLRKDELSGHHTEFEDRLLEYLPCLLSNHVDPTAKDLWPMLSVLTGNSLRQEHWDKVSRNWFTQHVEVRREIQDMAISQEKEGFWIAFEKLRNISAGLCLMESDVIYHLKQQVKKQEGTNNWAIWRSLVQYAQSHPNFTGEAVTFAKQQAEEIPELQPMLDKILSPPISDHERKHKERLAKIKQEQERKTLERHEHFSKVRADMEKGERLHELYDVARATLGRFWGYQEIATCEARITKMVGKENYSAAISGLEKAGKRSDIPTVRKCATLYAQEKREYRFEVISLALCVMRHQSGHSLDDIPRATLLCALYALKCGLFLSNENSSELEEILVDNLFQEPEEKSKFLSDFIEPSLESGEEDILGLHGITSNKLYLDVLPSLVIEWLSRFKDMSGNVAQHLLKLSLQLGNRGTLANLVETQLEDSTWPNEQHRQTWHATAFAVDFPRFRQCVDEFADESETHIWTFQAMVEIPQLSETQIYFLLDKFIQHWPMVEYHPEGYPGPNHPWEAAQFVRSLINALSEFESEEAIKCLKNLADADSVGEYRNHILGALERAERSFAEKKQRSRTLDETRSLLLRKPTCVENLISAGEDERVEFKPTLRVDLRTRETRKKSQLDVLKTIAGFLNTKGGTLLIGVRDDGEVIGLDADSFKNEDKMALHLTDLVKSYLGKGSLVYIHQKFEDANGKRVMVVECDQAQRSIFLKDGGRKHFFIRGGPATHELHGNDIIGHVREYFKKTT